MSEWLIDDDAVSPRCLDDLRINRGEWDALRRVWSFPSAEDAANALACVHARTRAGRTQRERLIEMIVEGTAHAAWPPPFHEMSTREIASVSRDEARMLIERGERFRRRAMTDFIEQMPAALVAKRFNVAAFERGLQARRAQIHHAPVLRSAA